MTGLIRHLMQCAWGLGNYTGGLGVTYIWCTNSNTYSQAYTTVIYIDNRVSMTSVNEGDHGDSYVPLFALSDKLS